MKKIITITMVALLGVVTTMSCSSSSQLPTAEDVLAITQKVADWQIENYEDQGSYRALPPEELRHAWHHRRRYPDQDWIPATLFSGMYNFSTIVDDTKYVNWLKDIAQNANYELFDRMYHADDHCIGQLYLYLAQQYNDPKLYEPTQSQFNEIMESEKGADWQWFWCDALFMAPPVWTRLAKLTGDAKYLEYMDTQYHKTYDVLWNKDESLFYRDKKFFKQQEANGKGVFWSRGNGWVFGGLAMMIPDMPAEWEGREFYISLFQTMASRLQELQREDGTWSAGLLGDLEEYQNIETSGSAFFAFGLAWGINNGILDRQIYEPTLLKAWNALEGAVTEDGLFGYVQGIGAEPGASYENYSELYGVGAFLAAGTQMYHYVTKFGTGK